MIIVVAPLALGSALVWELTSRLSASRVSTLFVIPVACGLLDGHRPGAGSCSMARRIVIMGGVAAGAKAGTRTRRLDEDAETIVFEKSG